MKLRFPISAKMILLILAALSLTVAAVVTNATHLFRKENLNNIYLFSDLLTAAKAGEVRFWINGSVKKGTSVARILLGSKSRKALRAFEGDQDIVFVKAYSRRSKNQRTFGRSGSWTNRQLIDKEKLSRKRVNQFREGISIRSDKALRGEFDIRSLPLDKKRPLLLVTVPITQDSDGKYSEAALIGIVQNNLLEAFEETGPYALSLVAGNGTILATKDVSRVVNAEDISAIPIVQKMMVSSLDREFTQYEYLGESFLGAYAKVGLAGIGVVSQVPSAIAFETGNYVVEQSFLIALFTLSAVFILAYVFVQTLINPVRYLSAAANEISKGNFGVRVDVASRDEMRDLAASFNAMGGEIEKKIDNLSRINEAGSTIASTLEAQELVNFALDTLMDLLGCERGVAWYSDPKAEKAHPVLVGKNWYSAEDLPTPIFLKTIQGFTESTITELNSKPILAVPIREKQKILGYVVLSDRPSAREDMDQHFVDEDLYVAGTILSSVGTTFENIKLLKETADKARMEKELETAHHVQETMFPDSELKTGNVEIQSYYTPAGECGGDWWGYIKLPKGKLLVAMGDATGHGVPAAMITATAKATFSVLDAVGRGAPKLFTQPRLVLHFLNKSVYESSHGAVLMTFFVAVIDTNTGEMTYASASHDPIFTYKMPSDADPSSKGDKNNLDVLECEPGPRLGQSADSAYTQATGKLDPGDLIYFYTDGLPEGKNPEQEEYGDRRFLRMLAKPAHKSCAEVRDGIIEQFHEWVQDEPLHDDVTLAILKFHGDKVGD